MDNGRWDRIQSIFEEALSLRGSERDDYVKSSAGNDLIVLNEVRTLLAAYAASPDLLEENVLDIAAAALSEDDASSLVGETIAHYHITEKLGRGGMGDVYLAEDHKLHRLVALKFLTPEFLHDARACRQLMHEAQLAAFLDHPNICKVFDFEEIGSLSFIVMQYVKGESLSTLLREGRISDDEKDRFTCEIVRAIAAAHESETIHRDIKPGNVIIEINRDVKVLDFGLAKIIHDGGVPQSARDYITNATHKGLILGTVAYMSPEQLKGERLDYGTDVFSLGTLILEMFSGRNPFICNSDAETIAAILRGIDSVSPDQISDIPSHLRRIVEKCLQVGKAERYRNAVELLEDLENRRDEGNLRLRVLKASIGILLIVSLVLGVYLYSQWRSDHGVAVLPFANETSDANLDYLADGIAESIGSKLSTVDGYSVVPYSKLSGLSAAPIDSASIGRRVRADVILTGRLFRESDQLKVETKLTDSSDGRVLRMTTQSLSVDRIAETESALIEELFSGLELPPFTVAADAESKRGGTKNDEAFRHYLAGRHYWRKRDRANMPKAIEAFQKAIELDQGYARAYAGLADTYVLMNSVAYGSMPARDAYSKARAAAKQALEIDPLNAEALTSLGVVLMKQDSNWAESERAFRRAIEIDPDTPSARFWFSGLLAQTGKSSESIAEAEKARELDPFSPLVDYNLARVSYFARQFDRSLEILRQVPAADQNDPKIRYLVGLNLLQSGSAAEALRIFQAVSRENKMLGTAAEGYTLGRLGRDAEALKLIRELERQAETNYVPPQEFAFIYMGLNDKDKAFEYLSRAADERASSLSALRVEPLFDSIRDDIRFADLLKKMSLDKL